MSRAGVAVVGLAAAVSFSVLSVLAAPAGADPEGSISDDGFIRITDSVDNVIGGDDGSGTGGGGGGGVSCWRRYGDTEFDSEVIEIVYERAGREVPSTDFVTFLNECRDYQSGLDGNDVRYWEPEGLANLYDSDHFLLWEIEDVAPGTPLEVPLLQQLWAELSGKLGGPEPVVTPPVGEPVVVDHYTFVAVDNPQYEQSEGPNCAPAPADEVCVTFVAEPTLTFDPGDGSDPIECEPEGTAFDPDGPPPAAQAEGGCAHAYGERSAAGFPGRVEVVWDVEWASTGHGGVSGVFDPLTLPGGDVPNALRVVDESQAVVDSIDA